MDIMYRNKTKTKYTNLSAMKDPYYKKRFRRAMRRVGKQNWKKELEKQQLDLIKQQEEMEDMIIDRMFLNVDFRGEFIPRKGFNSGETWFYYNSY